MRTNQRGIRCGEGARPICATTGRGGRLGWEVTDLAPVEEFDSGCSNILWGKSWLRPAAILIGAA